MSRTPMATCDTPRTATLAPFADPEPECIVHRTSIVDGGWQMAGLLEGRVAVVTGGSSGLGRGIAGRFAEEGAKAVIVADQRDEPREGGPTTTKLVEAAGADARFVTIDVRKVDDLRAAVGAAGEFGGIDVMVNNAGVAQKEDFFT